MCRKYNEKLTDIFFCLYVETILIPYLCFEKGSTYGVFDERECAVWSEFFNSTTIMRKSRNLSNNLNEGKEGRYLKA